MTAVSRGFLDHVRQCIAQRERHLRPLRGVFQGSLRHDRAGTRAFVLIFGDDPGQRVRGNDREVPM